MLQVDLPAPTIAKSAEHGLSVVNLALPLPHPAPRVWEILRDFGNAEASSDIAAEVKFEGDATGGIRTFKLKPELGGGSVSELIFDVSQTRRSFHYSVVDFGNAPFADYQGYMKISGASAGTSVLYYRARMFPTGMTTEAAADFAVNNLLALQRRLDSMLSG